MLELIALSGLCYLIGAFPWTYVIIRAFSRQGLINPNIDRVGIKQVFKEIGLEAAFLAAVGELLKGVIGIWLALSCQASVMAMVMGGTAILVGQIWPVLFDRVRCYGTLPLAGIVIMALPLFAQMQFALWMATYAITRIGPLATTIAALSLPVLLLYYNYHPYWIFFGILVATMITYQQIPLIRRRLIVLSPYISRII